ncbi:MAG: hypothetical protein GYA63_00220, partial [Armatimonadetes bacterium]|nr:hypothetical protein [Armatimonadota bacterium]
MRYLFLAALSILVLLGSPNPVLATIDFSMDTPGVIIQPTTVTVNLVVDTTSGGDTGSYGGVISIWFDPTKVEVSDPVANVTGYDMDCNFWDNVTGTQNFICTGLTEITATCSFLTFTVTPVGASADLSDCSVIRMTPGDFHVWPSSQLISLVYDTVYATGSCEETDSSSEETTDETTVPGPETTDTETDSNDETGGIVASSLFGCTPQIPATIRALKIAAGLMPANQSGNPNYKDTQSGEFPYLPLTLQDQATLEMVDTGGVSLLTHKITLADAVMLWNEQYLELPTNAVWAVAFLGSADDTCGNAANATGMPAIAQMDGYNAPEAIFPMGTINGQNYYPTFRYATGPETTHNPNAAYVVSDIGYGTFGLLNNWPRKLADAPTGVAVGAFTGGDYPQVLASNFQDQEGAGTINLYSRLYVW